jgi:acetyl-CoA carboxylase biotin carboxyl carrier protein
VAPRKSAPKATGGGAAPTVSELVELAVKHDLAELEVEQGGARIRVVRERAAGRVAVPRAEGVPTAVVAPASEPAVAAHLVRVDAPMVGTFYRAPGPDANPFVQEGDTVKEGQVLCIIEAMKLMNEIESKASGRIVKILVENAQPVEFGQGLFLVEPRA